jgi:hypothetical protein
MLDFIDTTFGITDLGIAQGRSIPKKTFYTHDYFKTAEKKLFTSDIDTITLIVIANEANTNIAPVINNEYRYEEVFFIHVVLREQKNTTSIAEIIHDVIPNPTIIIFTHENSLALSVAPKRLNKNEIGKVVIQDYVHSEWINTNEVGSVEQKFIDQLYLKNARFDNLLHFYEDICKAVAISILVELLGEYCYSKGIDLKQVLEWKNQYRDLKKSEIYHQNQNKQLKNFGDKVTNHQKLLDIRKKLEILRREIISRK